MREIDKARLLYLMPVKKRTPTDEELQNMFSLSAESEKPADLQLERQSQIRHAVLLASELKWRCCYRQIHSP